MSSLTPRAAWFVGLCHHRRRCSSSDRDTGARPVQRQPGSRGPSPSQPIRRPTSTCWTPLLGFIDHLSVDTTVLRPHPVQAVAWTSVRDCHVPNVLRSCRSSRLQRFPPQRPDPKTRPFDGPRVCCTPQPTMGFTTFRTPWLGLSTEPRPGGRRTRRSVGSRPQWRTPYEAFPSSAAWPCRHRAASFRTRSRSPTGVPSRRSNRARCRVATARGSCSSTSGLCSTEQSVAMRAALPLRARSMLPWALDRLVPMLPRASRRPVFRRDVSPRGPAASASPDPNVEGRQWSSGLVWLRARGAAVFPEGSTAISRGGSGTSRRRRLGRIPARAPKDCGMPVDPPREEVPPRRSEHPKVRGCRRHRDASPKRLVRDPALAPKSGDRWFELVLPILPQSPAYMMVRPLAADAHARRRARLRATRAHPEGCCVEPNRRDPEGSDRWANRRHHPEVGPWRLVAPATPASWRAGSGQTVIVFTGTAAARSEDRVASPIPKDRRAGAEAPRVRLVPHIPPVVVIRREHRSARAEMDRDPSQAVPTGVESASVPSAPKRPRSPDR